MPATPLPLAACIERHQMHHLYGTARGLTALRTELPDGSPLQVTSSDAAGLSPDALFERLQRDLPPANVSVLDTEGFLQGFARALPDRAPDWRPVRPRWAPEGIEADVGGAAYSLVARSDTELLGACLVRLSLEGPRMPYAAAADARTMHFTVELDLVHTLSEHRRRGVMSRLFAFVQHVVFDELRALLDTVERFRRDGKVPVKVVLYALPAPATALGFVARVKLCHALIGAHLAFERWSTEHSSRPRVVTRVES